MVVDAPPASAAQSPYTLITTLMTRSNCAKLTAGTNAGDDHGPAAGKGWSDRKGRPGMGAYPRRGRGDRASRARACDLYLFDHPASRQFGSGGPAPRGPAARESPGVGRHDPAGLCV